MILARLQKHLHDLGIRDLAERNGKQGPLGLGVEAFDENEQTLHPDLVALQDFPFSLLAGGILLVFALVGFAAAGGGGAGLGAAVGGRLLGLHRIAFFLDGRVVDGYQDFVQHVVEEDIDLGIVDVKGVQDPTGNPAELGRNHVVPAGDVLVGHVPHASQASHALQPDVDLLVADALGQGQEDLLAPVAGGVGLAPGSGPAGGGGLGGGLGGGGVGGGDGVRGVVQVEGRLVGSELGGDGGVVEVLEGVADGKADVVIQIVELDGDEVDKLDGHDVGALFEDAHGGAHPDAADAGRLVVRPADPHLPGGGGGRMEVADEGHGADGFAGQLPDLAVLGQQLLLELRDDVLQDGRTGLPELFCELVGLGDLVQLFVGRLVGKGLGLGVVVVG